jgi:predicted cupin superfamily sugar epimerase
MTADEVKELLQLEPLRMEGGFFRETYRSRWMISPEYLPEGMRGMHSIGTAIYFMITPESFSRLHRVPGSEIFHFYAGDPVTMLQLLPDGSHQMLTIGTDLKSGARPQVLVRGHVWMGCKLAPGAKWALMGTTMSPGFSQSDYEGGNREELIGQYPGAADLIRQYTRDE